MGALGESIPRSYAAMSYVDWGRFVQSNRLARVDTPLGPDALLVKSFVAIERVNQLYEFRIELLALDTHIELKTLLGARVSLELATNPGSRKFTGIVSEFAFVGADGGFARYELAVVPWMWMLGLRTDCAIFQEKSVQSIIEEVFARWSEMRSDARYEFRLREPLANRSFCVQYHESDLRFVQRLCEEEGLTFWFEWRDDGETLVIADDPAAYRPLNDEDAPRIPFARAAAVRKQDGLQAWSARRVVRPTATTLVSHDYKPDRAPSANEPSIVANGELPTMETYHYPGAYEFESHAAAVRCARIRQEAQDADTKWFRGEGKVRTLALARWFELIDHPSHERDPADARRFVVLALEHRGRNNYLLTEKGLEEAEGDYSVRLEAMRKDVVYRPLPTIGRPRIRGPQTAIVVGPKANEGSAAAEVYTDELNRVRVQFHWDRAGADGKRGDERSSCWVRVASSNADGGWGGVMTPRVGQEVVVAFLEGDPDRALVTGSVYNGPKPPTWHSNGALAGYKSKEFAGAGYTALVLDDTTQGIRATLGASLYATQMNLGYHVAAPYANERGANRGQGMEVRTDAYGAVRAGRGLLISTDPRSNASGTSMDAREPAAALHQHAERLKSLGAYAAKHNAGDLPSHAAATNAEKSIGASKEGLPIFEAAQLVASSPAGVNAVTPKDLHLAAGTNLALTSGKDANLAAGGRLAAAVQGALSFFAGTAGIKLFAAKGKLELQAQSDMLEITADKDVRVTAVEGEILVAAPESITLTAGGAYIKLQGGNIQLHAPGKFSVKGAQHKFAGPDSMSVALPAMPKAEPAPEKLKFEIRLQDMPGPYGKPLDGCKWKVVVLDPSVLEIEDEFAARGVRLDPKLVKKTVANGVTGSEGFVALSDEQQKDLWSCVGEYPGLVFLVHDATAIPLERTATSATSEAVHRERVLDASNFVSRTSWDVNRGEMTRWVEAAFGTRLSEKPKSDVDL